MCVCVCDAVARVAFVGGDWVNIEVSQGVGMYACMCVCVCMEGMSFANGYMCV
jgi:hypothetical protein